MAGAMKAIAGLFNPGSKTAPGGDADFDPAIVRGHLPRGPLVALCESKRTHELDKMERYWRCRQDDHKAFDWDGYFRYEGADFPIKPGWYVPLRARKPDARYEMARIIVRRYTSLLFGNERFPQVVVEGDPETEDFVRELVKAARLPQKMTEARNLGGAQGTACLSMGFKRGLPRIQVHNAKHCRVLEWEDRDEFIPRIVLKTYAFEDEDWDEEKRRFVTNTYYYVRIWTAQVDMVWERIPQKAAETEVWRLLEADQTVEHKAGFCPFYWVQNLPDSDEIDGESDYEGLPDLFDEINQTLSAAVRGTKRNVDPTLVINKNKTGSGAVKKGGDNVIWSESGASYLELKGDAARAALLLLEEMRNAGLDTAGVVLPSPEKLAGAAQSAAALRILFAPMLSAADTLRSQYGECIKRLLVDMLRVAKQILAEPPVELVDNDGVVTMERQVLALPPKVTREETERLETNNETGHVREHKDVEIKTEERKPGDSENISLNWAPYFPATWQDIDISVTAAQKASGGKPVISHRSAVKAVATHFGVEDPDEELLTIEDASEAQAERDAARFGAAPGERFEGDEKKKPSSKPPPKPPGGSGQGGAPPEPKKKPKEG